MHDYFDILGVSDDAPAREIRLACARRTRHVHPDFTLPTTASSTGADESHGLRVAAERDVRRADLAIDAPDMISIVARMQAAFLEDPR